MKRIILMLFCTLLPVLVMAQSNRSVRGVVFDADGLPMADVSLVAIGSADKGVSMANGTFEMMVSPYTKFIEASKDGYVTARAEVDGSYLVFKLLVDKKYLENKAKAAESARLEAEAKAKAEEEARLAEEKRLAAEKLAAEKARLAEEKRIAAEKAAAEKAEQARKVAEEKARLAEEKRLAAEKAAAEKAEAARLAAEEKKRIEEEKRLAAEKAAAEKAERERLEAEEKARLAEQQRFLNAQVAAGNADAVREAERLAAEERIRIEEEKRLAAEKVAAEKQVKIETRKANIEKWQSAKMKGYRSYVEAAFMMDVNLMPAYVINYIGGYQINNCFFVGAGTGLYLDGQDGDRNERWYNDGNSHRLSLNLVNVPVFAYFRANFANRRCTPFFAIAAGYRLSTRRNIDMPWGQTEDYWTLGYIINPQIGLNFRITPKYSAYIAVGGNLIQRPILAAEQGGADANGYYMPNVTADVNVGFDFRVGFTF